MITIRKNQALEPGAYEPTRNDIQRASKEIQATWSPRERSQRKRGPHAAWWLPPINRLFTLVESVSEERANSRPCVGAARNEGKR